MKFTKYLSSLINVRLDNLEPKMKKQFIVDAGKP